MSDDLVKQICSAWIADDRSDDCFWEGWPECPTPEDSLTPKMVMDRIEELEAENQILKTSGIAEVAVRNSSVMEYMQHWEGRAERAEAKLAKAVDALQKMDVGEGWAAQIARTTLAELKGKADD